MIIPTRRFWLLLALGFIFPLAGAFIPGLEMFTITYDLLLFILLIGSRLLVGDLKHLVFRRTMHPVLSVWTDNAVEWELANDGSRPISGRIRDEVPRGAEGDSEVKFFNLDPGRSLVGQYLIRPFARGTLTFPQTTVRVLAPLGLCEVQVVLDSIEDKPVYPNLLALQEFDLLKRRGRLIQGNRRTRYRGIGTEFESLRTYQRDDDYRRIDWKSSAKKNEFVVREFELEKNQPVMIIIDAGRTMIAEVEGRSKFDHVLDAVLLLAHAAVEKDDLVGVLVYAGEVISYVPPGRGQKHLSRVLREIHGLQPMPVEANHAAALEFWNSKWKRRSLAILFTDSEDRGQATALRQAIDQWKSRHLWFAARVTDPRIDRLEESQIADETDVFLRASLSWYRGIRKEAREILAASRMELIEAEPEHLADALVATYVDVKQRMAI